MLLVPLALAATVAGSAVATVASVNLAAGLSVAAFSLISAFLLRRQNRFVLLLACLAFFFLANARYAPLLVPSTDIEAFDQSLQRVAIHGDIADVRQLTDGRSRVDLLVDDIADRTGSVKLQRPLRVRLTVEGTLSTLLPGDRIRFSARLRQPRQFGTPGEFHWPRYLASQRVDMTSWVRSPDQIEKIGSSRRFPARQIVSWRTDVATAIDVSLPDRRASLVRALVLGEGRQLNNDVRKLLAGAGVSHLFAISGLHLGLLGFFGYYLLLTGYRRSCALLQWQPPQRVLPLVLLPLLFGYLLLTGDAVSTRRAFVLAGISALLLLRRYPVNPLHLLATVALAFLLWNPLLLWQASWQLSFCGAAGILLWRPIWQKFSSHAHWPKPVCYLLQVFLVTCAATAATLPLVLFNFHMIAPAALAANLVCVPVVTLVALPLGFIGLFLFAVFPPAAMVLFSLCGLLLEWLVIFCEGMTALPGLQAQYYYLSRWQHLAVGLVFVPLLMAPQVSRRCLVATAIVCCLAATLLWTLPWRHPAPVTLTMLSVGQGESLLLQNHAGQNMLIDGGGLFSQRFDVGERLLSPAFGELKVRRIDVMLLTHDHADHWKGLVYVLDRFSVGELWLGQPLIDHHPDLRQAVLRNGVPVRIIDQGWSSAAEWKTGRMSLFNGRSVALNENDASVVVYLDDEEGRGLLLTGDLESAGIDHLLQSGLPGEVTLLKLPHHGSRRSNAGALLDMVQAEVGLVSVGYQNLYRLPAQPIVGFFHQRGIPLLRTDKDGTVRVEMFSSGWRVRRWQRGLFR